MGRPADIKIDLSAIRHNYRQLKRLHNGPMMAVIKADAYGHGAIECARALSLGEVDAFAVAYVEEAQALRNAGVREPILILEGAFDVDQVLTAQALDLWLVVHQQSQIEMLVSALPASAGMSLWVKIDTGMNRLGFSPADASLISSTLRRNGLAAEVNWISHLSHADQMDNEFTLRQYLNFEAATAGLSGARSLAASAGMLSAPYTRMDWCRPGISLYGVAPVAGEKISLRPAMTFSSRIFATRTVHEGETVGYGGVWRANRECRIGIVAAGYGDGYPRLATINTPILAEGCSVKVAGRVSMDTFAIDITDFPSLGVESEVELWGTDVKVEDVAKSVERIPYELLTGIKRVPVRHIGR